MCLSTDNQWTKAELVYEILNTYFSVYVMTSLYDQLMEQRPQ